MVTVEQIIEQQDALLARFAEQAAELVGALQARAMAATDDAAMTDLSLAFQRTGRALRQTLALRLKLRKDAVQVGRFDDVRHRWAQTQARLKRTVELESLVVENLSDHADDEDLQLLVMEESQKPGFMDNDLGLMALGIGRKLQAIAQRHDLSAEPAPEPEPPPAAPQPAPRPAHAADYAYLGGRHTDGPWRGSG